MDQQRKIERQYLRFCELSDGARNEFDQKKVDRAFNRLAKMFPTKEEFQVWYSDRQTKIFVIR
jgi:hypothetical protein